MSKLIITEMGIRSRLCRICAISEEQKIMELRLEASDKKSILHNIYVGQFENIVSNIQAAFVRFGDGLMGYLPLNQTEGAIFHSRKKRRGSS